MPNNPQIDKFKIQAKLKQKDNNNYKETTMSNNKKATNEVTLRQLLICKLIPNLGVEKLKLIIEHYSFDEFLAMNNKELSNLKLKSPQISAITSPNEQLIDQLLHWQQQSNYNIINYFDSNYPALLKQTSSPPLLLFTHGDISLLNSPQIAIVGSRSLSITGQENAYQFAFELAELGITITSGLAIGVDGFSHKGALSAKGNTIAVLGTGVNCIYPKRHQALAKQISEQGLLISEFLPMQTAKPENFPRRNRIISGLCTGTLVIEAATKSGSLITAKYALEQNREVFAIPGTLSNPLSRGCHQLIKQGATLTEDVFDIINELPDIQQHIVKQKQQYEQSRNKPKCSETGDKSRKSSLINHISYDVTSVDSIAERANLAINEVLTQLLDMELAGEIVSVPGGYLRK